jgi:hypothetical protein
MANALGLAAPITGTVAAQVLIAAVAAPITGAVAAQFLIAALAIAGARSFFGFRPRLLGIRVTPRGGTDQVRRYPLLANAAKPPDSYGGRLSPA